MEPSPNTERTFRHELWRAGDLRWKLDGTQLALYDEIRTCDAKLYVTEGARKLGKSYAHGIIALETALQNPGKQVNWSAITGKEARNVLLPILEEISSDAPDECRGRYDHESGQFRLPNTACIQLIGAETKKDCEKGRGPSAVLNIIDEAGFHEHLDYEVDSIFSPQLRRVKRVVGTFIGMTLLVSTTPYTPAHPFCAMADAASANGAYRRLTIWDSGFESKEEVEAYIASEARKKNMDVAAFMATTHFRREYLSERVVDEEVVVFPEFHGKQSVIVREHPRPVGFEQYVYKRVAIDLGGMRDKYGFLYGYVDWQAAKIVIEDEALLAKPNTEQVALELIEHESSLWPDANPARISRVIDDDTERTIRDLWSTRRIGSTKAVKQGPGGGRASAINMIRTYIQHESLLIHPRCVELRKQLLTATRNKTGTDFERTNEGHFDLCAALMYFVRELSFAVNPYPDNFSELLGRGLPAHHPIVARRERMGGGVENTMAGALLGGNRYVQAQLRRRK